MRVEGLAHAAEFLRCLRDLDVAGITKLHNHVHPEAPVRSAAEALTTLHLARTQCEKLPLKLRQYSHKWLLERGIGSMLPERLWPNSFYERQNSKRFLA